MYISFEQFPDYVINYSNSYPDSSNKFRVWEKIHILNQKHVTLGRATFLNGIIYASKSFSWFRIHENTIDKLATLYINFKNQNQNQKESSMKIKRSSECEGQTVAVLIVGDLFSLSRNAPGDNVYIVVSSDLIKNRQDERGVNCISLDDGKLHFYKNDRSIVKLNGTLTVDPV